MATLYVNQRADAQFTHTSPYGNTTTLYFPLKTDATGRLLESNGAAALAANDVIVTGELPEGFRIDAVTLVVTTPMTAGVTGNLGILYADGVDSTELPQSATLFLSAEALSSAKRKASELTSTPILPKAAKLILTIAAGTNAKASDLGVLVTGVLTGQK